MKNQIIQTEGDKIEMVTDAVTDLQAKGMARPSAETIKQHILDNHGVTMDREDIKKYRRLGVK